MKAAVLSALLLGIPFSAAAAVYTCKDASGRITYTQTPANGANCTQGDLGRPAIYTSVKPSPSRYTPTPPADTAQAPANAANTADPKQIEAAKARLQEAQKALEEGRKVRYGNERNYVRYLERIAGLEKAVQDAEKQLQDLSSPQQP
ncbi:MAG: DUF4124 domain-containing protein [Neisseria sp.]|nr:DUF4124 domain-containing protein [Neisseria sp.]